MFPKTTDCLSDQMFQALDLWMAGCMMFVFAALGEFVVVKVLDKQYQMNKSKAQESMPRIIPVVMLKKMSNYNFISYFNFHLLQTSIKYANQLLWN